MTTSLRNSLKISPFADKVKLREGLLKKAVEKMRSDRWKNIARLRGGVLDCAELAKSIFNDAIGERKSLHESQYLPSTYKPDEMTAMEGCGNSNHSESLNRQDEIIYSPSMAPDSQRNQLVYEDDSLLDYLGSEEHQLLMDEIAEAIKRELEEEYTSFDCGEMDEMADADNFDWSNYDLESAQDATIICPICRLADMQISSEAGQCSCGALIAFQGGYSSSSSSFDGAASSSSSSNSATAIANRLKERLAEIIDMHAIYCPSIHKTNDNAYQHDVSTRSSNTVLGAGDLKFYQSERNGVLFSHCSYCNFNQQVT